MLLPKTRNMEKGFTLMELLVVIAILGILVSLAAPSFRDMIERQKIRAALNEWQSAFFFAQKEAMRLKEPVRLCASSGDVNTAGISCNDSAQSKEFNGGWIVVDRAGSILQDYAVNEPGISIFLSAENGIMFRSNGSVAGVTNTGEMAGGFFAGHLLVGPAPGNGSNAGPASTHRNTIRMDISSGGRLVGARR